MNCLIFVVEGRVVCGGDVNIVRIYVGIGGMGGERRVWCE